MISSKNEIISETNNVNTGKTRFSHLRSSRKRFSITKITISTAEEKKYKKKSHKNLLQNHPFLVLLVELLI